MLNEMKQIALDYLFNELGDNQKMETSLIDWYKDKLNNEPEMFKHYFVESVSGIEKVYILEPDKRDSNLVNMSIEDITEKKLKLFPFLKPAGSQSAQIGPTRVAVVSTSTVSPR